MCMISHVRLSAIPWTGTHQAPLSMGFLPGAGAVVGDPTHDDVMKKIPDT